MDWTMDCYLGALKFAKVAHRAQESARYTQKSV